MADEVRVEIDVDAALAPSVLHLADLAEAGARYIAEEIRSSIPDSSYPSSPGQPPHSTGPYRDSWRASRVSRGLRVKNGHITAYAFSQMRTKLGVPLALILDQGLGNVAPRPHLAAGTRKAQQRMDAEVDRLNSSLRGG